MNRIIVILFVFLAFSVNAIQITPKEASIIAVEFLSSTHPQSLSSEHIVVKQAVPSVSRATTMNGEQPYYVFNAENNQGFVIVSGDHRTRQILGYSNHGNIDFENLPPQLQGLLALYETQIERNKGTHNIEVALSPNNSNSEADVKLLATAEWGQDFPFNKMCPITTDNKLCLTGCTATAMAIVMKYHNWPETGKGSQHYHQSSPDLNMDLSFDFENTPFDWSAMPDIITSVSPEREQSAVGTLMLAAGISINTIYGCGASNADFNDVVGALRMYFKYDCSCQYIARHGFTSEEYMDIIHRQIDSGNPVLMSGHKNIMTGHSWVVDGYDRKNQLLHFNWGWSGVNNGFFALDAVTEDEDYPDDRNIIINIFPKRDDKEYALPYVEYPSIAFSESIEAPAGLIIGTEKISSGETFSVMVNILRLPPRSNYEIYLGLIDERGNIKESISLGGCSNISDKWLGSRISRGNLHFTNSIADSDHVQLYAEDRDNPNGLLPITGSLDAPSSRSVINTDCDLSVVKIETDASSIIKLKNSWVEDYVEVVNGEEYKVIAGSDVYFEITAKEMLDNHALTLLYNGELDVNINGIPISIWESDYTKIVGHFVCKSGTSTLQVQYESLSGNRDETLTTAGTLHTVITPEVARTVSSLKISGEMNALDFWYITKHFQCLNSLDLQDVKIIESEPSNLPTYDNIFIESLQPADYLPDLSFWGMNRLSRIILPKRLKAIGENVLNHCNLLDIQIPDEVETIGAWFANNNLNLSAVYSLNPIPPVFRVYENFEGSQCFENGALYVPEGSVDAYRKATVWRNFHNILSINSIQVNKIVLSPAELVLEINGTRQIAATVLPELAVNKTLKWTTNDAAVASIDATGKVTALAVGEVTITATSTDGSDVSASCVVKVTPILVEAISIDKTEWNGIEGENFHITATVLPDDATNKALSWISSDENIATVDESGNVKVIKAGSCLITVSTTDGSNLTAECKITGSSAIDDIFVEKDTKVDIYNLSGILIRKGINRDEMRTLSPGIYLIRCSKKEVRKVIIH